MYKQLAVVVEQMGPFEFRRYRRYNFQHVRHFLCLFDGSFGIVRLEYDLAGFQEGLHEEIEALAVALQGTDLDLVVPNHLQKVQPVFYLQERIHSLPEVFRPQAALEEKMQKLILACEKHIQHYVEKIKIVVSYVQKHLIHQGGGFQFEILHLVAPQRQFLHHRLEFVYATLVQGDNVVQKLAYDPDADVIGI